MDLGAETRVQRRMAVGKLGRGLRCGNLEFYKLAVSQVWRLTEEFRSMPYRIEYEDPAAASSHPSFLVPVRHPAALGHLLGMGGVPRRSSVRDSDQ